MKIKRSFEFRNSDKGRLRDFYYSCSAPATTFDSRSVSTETEFQVSTLLSGCYHGMIIVGIEIPIFGAFQNILGKF